VVAERQVCFRDLVLERKQAGEPPLDEAAAILAERVLAEELKLKQWNHSVESWLARIRIVQQAMPELDLPEFSDDDKLLVITEVCQGAITYKQIKDKPVLPVLKQWLSPPHRSAVESYAPEQVTLSNGVKAKIDYVTNPEPAIAVILQRLYDVHDTPTIVDGRVTLKVHILAPNQRPAQVTNDLRGFWENSYPAVKKDLKGRYPKHEWR
jgi:ATP-dependent helicase HrpB